MKLRLQARYTLAIGGLVFSALMILWLAMTAGNRAFTRHLEQATAAAMAGALQRQGEQQVVTVAESVAERLAGAIRRRDPTALAEAVRETRRYPAVLSVQVVDPAGVLLHDGTDSNSDAGTPLNTPAATKAREFHEPVVTQEMESLRVAAPVLDDNTLLGVALVQMSRVDNLGVIELERGSLTSMIRGQWLNLAVNGVFTALALVVMAMLAAAIVANRLALPIGALALRARAIGQGDRNVRGAPNRSDELGDLARAFDEMASALQMTTVSKEYVDNILQSMAEMLVVTDDHDRIVTANRAFLRETGLEENALIGRSIAAFVSDPPALGPAGSTAADHHDAASNHELRRSDDTVVPVQVSVTPLRENGNTPAGRVYVMQNIAERLAASRQIERSLRENQILLKEIHHRVKNNLQIISSMLSLQAARTEDKRSRAVFIESESRIRAMALIHEQLYRSGDLARVDIGEYIENLSRQIARYLGRLDCKVEVSCDFHEVSVDVAIPCGLIVNELVTNCIQHAFPDGRPGTVSVWFTASEGQRELIVSDDGVGLEGADLDSGATLGLKLVRALVHQLDGRLEITSEGGATFRAVFPIKASEKGAKPAPERAA